MIRFEVISVLENSHVPLVICLHHSPLCHTTIFMRVILLFSCTVQDTVGHVYTFEGLRQCADDFFMKIH